MKKLCIIIAIAFCLLNIKISYGDQIFTTLTPGDGIIYDGKWTFLQEWKPTSENVIKFDDGYELSVKTGHDYNNLYVLLDRSEERRVGKECRL